MLRRQRRGSYVRGLFKARYINRVGHVKDRECEWNENKLSENASRKKDVI